MSTSPQSIPEQFKTYFWDTTFGEIDPHKNASYIIERLLDKGNTDAIRWVRKSYDKEHIIKTLTTIRGFSLRNAAFWAAVYDIPLSQIKCFQEPYLKTRRKHWPY